MKRSVFFLLCLPLWFFCNYKGNIYDRNDPDYASPSFTIDADSSNVADGDTVTADTLRIILVGNDKERRHNLFRWSFDNGGWSKWDGDGKEKYEIILTDLSGGTHTLAIEVCYNPEEEIADSMIAFFKAEKPSITTVSDTAVAVDAQAACTLRVKARGTGDLAYSWYRGGVKLVSPTSDSLVLAKVSLADTGVYYCRVSNAWGIDASIGIHVMVQFRVFYDGNENTGGIVPVDTNGYEPGAIATTLGNPGNLSLRGYAFAGWNTRADGSGNTRDSSDIFKMDTFNVTLYAKWAPNPSFPLFYDGNGATGGKLPDTARVYRTGELIAVAGNSGNLVKSGYTFTGWNTKIDGSGKGYGENDLLEMGDEAIILYAQWSDNPTFTVTYDGNGSDGGIVPPRTTHRYNTEVTLATETPVRTGHTFYRWNTSQAGDGEDYKPGDKFTIGDKNVTLYARWTINRYAVAYIGNGNTAGKAPDSVTADFNTPVTVAGKGSLERDGYSFTGWNTKADGSGTAYPADTTVAMKAADLTLYAQWKVDGYTVIFDARGGNPAKTERAAHYGDTVTSPDVSKTGYSLENWYRDSAYTAVWDFADDTVTGDMTLYAKWTANAYTVTFDKNDSAASGSMEHQTITFAATVPLTQNGFSKTGWSFAGWATSAGGEVEYANGADYTMGAGNDTLYAKWTANSYTVTFDKNDPAASGSMAAQTMTFAATVPLTLNGFSKTGWSFAGWATSTTGEIVYADEADYTMGPGDDTLYAKWTRNSYRLTYNANGATTGTVPAAVDIPYGDSVTVAQKGTLDRTGYSFSGWNTKADGSGIARVPGTKLAMGAVPDTLWAQWSRNNYRLNYIANGATSGTVPTAVDIPYGDSVTVAPKGTLDRTGYNFTGWNTNSNGSGIARAPGTKFAMGAAPDTLWAQWLIRTFTVTFNTQGGSTAASQIVPYGSHATVPASPTLSSCDFNFWYKEPQCFNQWDFSSDVIVSDTTLYAGYTVTDIDGNVYKTVLIGNQRWMAENLKTTRYRDGTAIPRVTDDAAWEALTSPGYCYYNNDSAAYNGTYGILYNWYAVADSRQIAPAGWHVPTDAEWTDLGLFTGSAGKLKEAGVAHWNTPNTDATNETGFNALPGGYRYNYGTFTFIGYYGHWWTSTESVRGNAWNRDMHYTDATLFRNNYNESYGFSVRCLLGERTHFNVSFNSQGGTSVPSQSVQQGSHATAPTSPTLSGCTFDGWYREPQCFNKWNFSTEAIISDTTLYAGYTVTDIDGNVYKTVLIGNQRWMAENLKAKRYRDGTAIPRVTDNAAWSALSTPGYCWYENDSATYNAAYGIMYNWYTAADSRQIAPAGWHVPTDAEWSTLEAYLGGSSVAGGKLKEAGTAHWSSPNTGATNESGFSALPGGYRDYHGPFTNIVNSGHWWSTTEYNATNAWYCGLYYNGANLGRSDENKSVGFSIRCVRD